MIAVTPLRRISNLVIFLRVMTEGDLSNCAYTYRITLTEEDLFHPKLTPIAGMAQLVTNGPALLAIRQERTTKGRRGHLAPNFAIDLPADQHRWLVGEQWI
jgi:hypothetical protein